MSGDTHGALAGSASILMGGLCLPLGAVAHLGGTSIPANVLAPAVRTVVCLVCAALAVRALSTTTITSREAPSRLLPVTTVGIVGLFALLLCLDAFRPDLFESRRSVVAALAAVRSLTWICVAALALSRPQAAPGCAAPPRSSSGWDWPRR